MHHPANLTQPLNCLLTILIAWSSFLTSAQAADKSQPNILWITVEDMSPRLGCYGDRTVATPNIDQLAAESVRYRRAFGVYGVCSPNRHTLILGMYPTSTGAMAMRTWKRTAALDQIKDPKLLAIPTYEATPPPHAHCFTQYLRARGYYCSNNVKTDYQFRDPITAWDESSSNAHWRNRPTSETPFFSVFNFTVTHESGTFKQRSPPVVKPSRVTLPPYYPDRPLLRQDLARHYDNIAVLDQQVGDLLKQLHQDNLLENTIIFFFSDHGDGLPRMKRWVYDSGIQVPLLIRYPNKARGGTTNEELVSFVDFAPSVLSLAGIPVPKHMQGQAFLGSQKTAARKYIYAARDRMDPAPETIRAVRDKRFKYVRNYRADLPYIGFIPYRDRAAGMKDLLQLIEQQKLGPDQWQLSSRKKPLEELYDTQEDPHEIHNLVGDPRYLDKLAELRSAHLTWTKKTADLGHLEETELIKKLWPPDGVQPTTASPTISLQKSRRRGGPLTVSIRCATEGASIAYRLSDSSRWLLYSEPFSVRSPGIVVTTAIRLGWKPSPTVTMKIK